MRRVASFMLLLAAAPAAGAPAPFPKSSRPCDRLVWLIDPSPLSTPRGRIFELKVVVRTKGAKTGERLTLYFAIRRGTVLIAEGAIQGDDGSSRAMSFSEALRRPADEGVRHVLLKALS